MINDFNEALRFEEKSNTFFIQNADDMDFERIRDSGRIGITAGASTPNKLIQEVQTLCQNLNSY